MDKSYPILPWRAPADILACWLVIALSVLLTLQVSFWFYPLSALLIGNRLLALSLLCHEGLHGNLNKNKRINDFLGRYFCAYPACISLSRYRRLHLVHHAAIGFDQWDPDFKIYDFFPISRKAYFFRQLKDFFTLKTLKSFAEYYSELFDLKKLHKDRHPSSDLFSYYLFFIFAFAPGFYWPSWWLFLAIFWLIPLLLVLPYVLFIGALQHGRAGHQDPYASRTIVGSKMYMWLLLPCDINFHAEHHFRPQVPHYWLKQYSADLKKNGKQLWQQSYWEACRDLLI